MTKAVLLPATGRGIPSAVEVACRAVAEGTELVVAVTVPNCHTHGWGSGLPIVVAQQDFLLDMMTALTVALEPTGVAWTFLPVHSPRVELPVALRGVTELYLYAEPVRRSFSVRALRQTRAAAALAKYLTADVRLIRKTTTRFLTMVEDDPATAA